jgi:hypothetical protein
MFYVLTESGIFEEKTLAKLNKSYKLNLTLEEFKPIGEDYFLTLNKDNLEYVKDLKKIAEIPMANLFKSDTQSKLIQYIILGVSIINLLKG